MSKNFKVILFDSDGVLAHTEELFFKINSQCFAEMSIPYTRHDFKNHTFITSLGTTGFMKKHNVTDEQIQEFKSKRNLLWQKAIMAEDVVDPIATTVLKELKINFKIGIVTNTDKENFSKIYHASDLPKLVDFIITREDYKNGKPKPDSYIKALAVAGVSSAEALVVEDSPRGITAAKSANLAVIAISNPAFKNLDISQADYHISSLSDLPKLIQKIT